MTLYEDAYTNLQKMLGKKVCRAEDCRNITVKTKNFNGYYNFFGTVNIITNYYLIIMQCTD